MYGPFIDVNRTLPKRERKRNKDGGNLDKEHEEKEYQ